MSEAFDIAIIGGGPSGYSTALRAAELGKRVAMIERDATLGGTCLNRGCIPSKALISAFDGMHPRLRQVPPSVASRSIMATRLPSSAARKAVEYPLGPPPIIAMSKASLMFDSFVLVPRPSPS